LRACFEGDAQAVAAYLRDASNKVHDNALTNACAQGHEDIVELLLSDPRVDPGAQRNSAFGAAVIHKHPAIMRRLFPLIMTPDAEKQCYEFALNHGHQLAHLYPFLIQHSRTAPVNAFLEANDADTVRALLDKPRVTLRLYVICRFIFHKRTDLLRVFADTPWLGFSRRALLHLQLLAKKHGIPHVFPVCDNPSAWELEENVWNCERVHGTAMFHYQKANPTVLAVVWCAHQVTGWADMAEPLIERLPHVITLELDTEGPILGIPGVPWKVPMLEIRATFWLCGILSLGASISSAFWTKELGLLLEILFVLLGVFCIVFVILGPSQEYKNTL